MYSCVSNIRMTEIKNFLVKITREERYLIYYQRNKIWLNCTHLTLKIHVLWLKSLFYPILYC